MLLPDRYSITNLRRALKHPRSSAYWEFRNWHRGLVRALSSDTSPLVSPPETDVMARNWDNLLVLDACRFNAFSKVNEIDGRLEKICLNASNSSEFVREYFSSRTHHDTVLVTGNPHSPTAGDGVFHDVRFVEAKPVDSERYPGPPIADASIVSPEEVVSTTLDVHRSHPNKRLVSHFMQPHLPFLGDIGKKLYAQTLSEADDAGENIFKDEQSWVAVDIYKTALKRRYVVDVDDIWAAYLENLEIVLEYAAELVAELDGKTVITADHGELLGDRLFGLRYFGHPAKIRTPALNVVPWFIAESSSRREVIKEQPEFSDRRTDLPKEEQLAALGYK